METNERLSKDEELRAENALKTLNLELNYNAQTFIDDDAPPELVNQWLDNILRFEEAHAGSSMKPLLYLIGNPGLLPLETLDDAAAEAEINRLLLLLFEHNVYIDRPAHVPALAYYSFLTDEFLQFEIPDVRLPGMLHVFSYEEFMEERG